MAHVTRQQVNRACDQADEASQLMWTAIEQGKPQEEVNRLSNLHDYYEQRAARLIHNWQAQYGQA